MWTKLPLVLAVASLVGAPSINRDPAAEPPDDVDSLTLSTGRELAAIWNAQPPGIPPDIGWTKDDLRSVIINNTLDRFHESAAKADFDTYFAVWTANSVFLGTDATERWVGDEFKDFARPIFAKGKGWTYKPRDRHITMAARGAVAYFDELLDNAKLGLCRGSGVLEKRGDDWKILQYNLSIPIPNDLAEELTGRVRAGGKPAAPPADAPPKPPKPE